MLIINNKTLVTITTLLYLSLTFTTSAKEQPISNKIAGEYIITFATDTPKSVINDVTRNIQREQNSRSIKLIKGSKTIAGAISSSRIEQLHTNPYIKSIEANRTIRHKNQPASNISAMRAYIDAWGVDRLDQNDLPLDGDFSPQGNGQGVNIYIIDSGIRLSHNEFEGRAQWAFTASSINDGDDDLNGSGTLLAGTVGSRAWGVANGATMHAVKVADATGTATLEAIVEGINFVANSHQAPAVALLGYSTPYSQALNDAVQSAIDKGVIFIVPAGDTHRDACTHSPGSVTTAITVAASSQTDSAAVATNFGECIDVYAPGLYIKSAWISGDTHNNSDSHTPIAAAHVAGAAAIILGHDQSCTTAQVKQQIIANTRQNKLTQVPDNTANLLLGVPAAGSQLTNCSNVDGGSGSGSGSGSGGQTVEDLSETVIALSQQLDSLTSSLTAILQCNNNNLFFAPSNPIADSNGCVNNSSQEFNTDILYSTTANADEGTQSVSFNLIDVVGLPTHLRISTRCATLGSDGFAYTSVSFQNSDGDTILSLKGCHNHGVSNGQSTGMGNDKIVPIPTSTYSISLNANYHRVIGGAGNNEARVTVDILGK